MKSKLVLILSLLSISYHVEAQNATAIGKFLVAETKTLIQTSDCDSMISALEILHVYTRLGKAYNLEPLSKSAIRDLKDIITANCQRASSTQTTGTFVNFKMTTPNGQVISEKVPAFIYSSFLMENVIRKKYLAALDSNSQKIYNVWIKKHETVDTLLRQQTDKLKTLQRNLILHGILTKADLKKYNVDGLNKEK